MLVKHAFKVIHFVLKLTCQEFTCPGFFIHQGRLGMLGCLSLSGSTTSTPFISAIKANLTSLHNSVLRTYLAYRSMLCLILSDHIKFPEGNLIPDTFPVSKPLLWSPLSCAYSLFSLSLTLDCFPIHHVYHQLWKLYIRIMENSKRNEKN